MMAMLEEGQFKLMCLLSMFKVKFLWSQLICRLE